MRATAPLPSTLTTSKVRFGRSKPERIDTGSCSPRRAAISCATRGVAVAVAAITAGRPARAGRSTTRSRRAGADSPGGSHDPTRPRNAPRRRRTAPPRAARAPRGTRAEAKRSGAASTSSSRPRRSRASACSLCPSAIPEASIVALTPACCSRRHWSAISAISGLTTTTSPIAGERRQLVAERLAAARGHHDEAVPAGERRRHRLALARPELLQAEARAAAPRDWHAAAGCPTSAPCRALEFSISRTLLRASAATARAGLSAWRGRLTANANQAAARRPDQEEAAQSRRRHTTRAPRDGTSVIARRRSTRPSSALQREPAAGCGSSSPSIVLQHQLHLQLRERRRRCSGGCRRRTGSRRTSPGASPRKRSGRNCAGSSYTRGLRLVR